MKKYLIIILSTMSMMYSCSDDFESSTIEAGDLPISIDAEYPVKGVGTRATDNGFVVDDAVGLFVVDYNRDGTPGELVMKGNRADNVKFTFTGGGWVANYQLYWGSKNTPADFYGYYPFNENMQSVTEYTFSVYKNQDGTTADKSNYEQSDLLWAKAEKVQPTADAVQLQYRHLMAGITIQLQMGTGFEASEWAQLDKTVLIDNVQTNATVNLQTGSPLPTSPEGEEVITPLFYNNVWRAVVVPQTVAAGKRVINITVNGKNYALTKQEAVQYISGKMHNFTITVNKNTATGEYTFELTADDIVAWVDDADLHDGLVRQYVIVDVNEAGTFSRVMAYRGIEADKVTALKLQGNLNEEDLSWMREHCTHLTDLNMSKVILQDGVLSNMGIPTMRHYVFPEKSLKVIAGGCFIGATGLNNTYLTLPEGLETIEGNSFGTYDLGFIGELRLPNSLRYLRDQFAASKFTGELHLPEGIIEAVGPSGDFTGSLHFPSSLQKVSGQWGYKNMTGTVVIPRCMTKVNGFWDGAGFNHVEFHDGVTEICGNAFRRGNLSGEIVFPPNLRRIDSDSFRGNKFSKIIFNDELRIIEDGGDYEGGTFCDNPYLSGTLELPKNVARIPKGCFRNCPGITEIVIPEGVVIIDDKAFEGCNGIASIVCKGGEPPVVGKDAFFGVNKDNFTVEVPKGCVEKYKNADGWKEFKRIAEYSNFVCRPAQANALNNAHDEALVLNADGAWTVKHQPDWVRLSKTSGNGKSEIQLTFLDMPHGNGMRRDSILFEMGGSAGSPTVETYCVVSQYDYEHEEDSYLTLQKHSKGNGIDIVFMGDGWTGADISSGEYLDMVRQQTEYFFGIEPYKSHREYFNVYVTFPLSQEKGVNTMHTYVNNRFGTLYGHTDEFTIDHLLTEMDEVYKYAVDKTPMTEGDRWKGQLILIPNSDEYEGVTLFRENDNCALSLCPPSSRPYPQDTRGTVQHEACGHGFGKLGDENVKYQAWATPNILGQIEGYHNRGWYRNLATTSKMNQVWWADMIFDPRYSDQVDVFEGGYGYMRGVFRPENNSCMNYGIPYFNAPSRKDIMWRILDYSGVGYSDDYFYSHDTNKWGDTDGQTRAGAAHASLTGNAITSSNNHCAPMVVNAKTMGNQVINIINRNKNK